MACGHSAPKPNASPARVLAATNAIRRPGSFPGRRLVRVLCCVPMRAGVTDSVYGQVLVARVRGRLALARVLELQHVAEPALERVLDRVRRLARLQRRRTGLLERGPARLGGDHVDRLLGLLATL